MFLILIVDEIMVQRISVPKVPNWNLQEPHTHQYVRCIPITSIMWFSVLLYILLQMIVNHEVRDDY